MTAFRFLKFSEIDGKSLGFALEKQLSKTFLELAIMCKAVICCMSFLVPHLSVF